MKKRMIKSQLILEKKSLWFVQNTALPHSWLLSVLIISFILSGIVPSFAADTRYCTFNGVHNDRYLSGQPGGFIYDQSGIGGNLLPVGSYIQYVWAGPDMVINAPDSSGNPGGDDQLMSVPNPEVGDDNDTVYTFTNAPGELYHQAKLLRSGSGSLLPIACYIRAWNAPSVALATHYGNSGLWGCPGYANVWPPPQDNLISLASFATVLLKPGIQPTATVTATTTFSPTVVGTSTPPPTSTPPATLTPYYSPTPTIIPTPPVIPATSFMGLTGMLLVLSVLFLLSVKKTAHRCN